MTIAATRACSKCKEDRPVSMFQHYKGRPSGQCRVCKTSGMKTKRAADGIPVKTLSRIEGDKKLCLGCDTMKPLTMFSRAKRGLGSVSAYCRPCFADRARDSEASRRRTATYRKRNRPRYLALHRLTQFRRKQRIAVADDGTVTDEFLNALYATQTCFYCGETTPENKRTADHKHPLARGGAHSADNMVMACNPCNSAKGNRTAEEFQVWRERNDNNGEDHRGFDQSGRDSTGNYAASIPEVYS